MRVRYRAEERSVGMFYENWWHNEVGPQEVWGDGRMDWYLAESYCGLFEYEG